MGTRFQYFHNSRPIYNFEIIILLLLFYYYYYKSVSSRIIITKRSFIRLKKVFFLGVLSPFVASFMEHLHSFSVNEPYCIFLTTYQKKIIIERCDSYFPSLEENIQKWFLYVICILIILLFLIAPI